VTSETQSQSFGGDYPGSSGHFHKIIPLSATLQPVTIMFSELQPPSWNEPPGPVPAAFAIKKLQAIDWGLTTGATRTFDIELDDIELF
jgi:hypothetical protein